ncbi:MAG TPA: DUF1064 domain-containing protein [Candidatus Paceibacterota bacterium]
MPTVRLPGARKNKYGARGEYVDNVYFDSQAEARRYRELKLMLASGDISGLTIHPIYHLHVPIIDGTGKFLGKEEVSTYEADFAYWDCRKRKGVVEDVKSVATRTALYKLKRKWLLAEYGITIQEVEM